MSVHKLVFYAVLEICFHEHTAADPPFTWYSWTPPALTDPMSCPDGCCDRTCRNYHFLMLPASCVAPGIPRPRPPWHSGRGHVRQRRPQVNTANAHRSGACYCAVMCCTTRDPATHPALHGAIADADPSQTRVDVNLGGRGVSRSILLAIRPSQGVNPVS